jgi:hypothetical protein
LRCIRRADYNIGMYDPIRGTYTFACPSRGETRVALSAFRELERIPGAAHPAVYRILFECPCGEEHPGLVSHDDLDWAPLGLAGGVFYNFMTSHVDHVAEELGDLAARRIQSGDWPWSFFCYPEERPQPVYPSAFLLLAPGDGSLGLAVSCPSCGRTSVNLVSHSHVDVPFHHDATVGVVEHLFPSDAATTIERFRAELYATTFDLRRLRLQ